MYKKLLVTFILLATLILSSTLCFANDAGTMLQDASNTAKNVVGGAENAVRDAANGISNGAQNITRGMENGAQNITEGATHQTENVAQGTMNAGYNATRTATDTAGTTTFMGMNATSWTWLIMGIAAIAIVALVWYYGSQVRTSRFDDNDQY